MTKEIGPIVWTDTPHGKQAVIDHGPEQTVLSVDEFDRVIVTTFTDSPPRYRVQSVIVPDAQIPTLDNAIRYAIEHNLWEIERARQCPSE